MYAEDRHASGRRRMGAVADRRAVSGSRGITRRPEAKPAFAWKIEWSQPFIRPFPGPQEAIGALACGVELLCLLEERGDSEVGEDDLPGRWRVTIDHALAASLENRRPRHNRVGKMPRRRALSARQRHQRPGTGEGANGLNSMFVRD